MTDEERKARVLLIELRGLYEATAEKCQFRGTLNIPVDEDDSDAIETLLNLINKQEKAIDRMAEVLNDFDYDKQCEKCRTDICSASVDGTEYMKCIKEYFMEDKE